MEYFLKNGVLQYLVNAAEKADYPVGFRGETIRMIANMVDLLDDRFLVHNAVHRPTVRLLRFCVLDDTQSELNHEDLVDLMYIICSKIYGFPALLHIFFHNTKGDEYEFLLFAYLLRFVHREGRSGDYARTGLLFVMEMATGALGDFVLSSDFSTIMAAGLGALYSQLPRKLIVQDDFSTQTRTAYLLGQENPMAANIPPGAEFSSSPTFRYQLDAFLKLLEFCQDVLVRCPHDDICAALLRSVRGIFLENILYPSILECSDADGSSVAVISYIDIILQTVKHDAFADLIVGFLFDDEEQDESPAADYAIHNCSNLFAGLELDRYKSSPYFTAAGRFTLKDLVFSRLKSSSQAPVIATLRLLRTLVTNHCRYALKLLTTCRDTDELAPGQMPATGATTVSHHIREIDLYFSLVTAIDEVHASDTQVGGYENYLSDLEMQMECDGCFQGMHSYLDEGAQHSQNTTEMHPRPRARRRRSFKYGTGLENEDDAVIETGAGTEADATAHFHPKPPTARHRIRPTDPLLQILLGLLSNFFAQSPELNLALTGVISALALCPHRSLEGWIAFRESDRTNPQDILVLDGDDEDDEDNKKHTTTSDIKASDIYHTYPHTPHTNTINDEDDDVSVDFGVEASSSQMTDPTHFKSFPPFFTLFRTLTQQVDYYRSEIEDFDAYLVERRDVLLHQKRQTKSVARSASPTPSVGSSLTAAAGYLFGFGAKRPQPVMAFEDAYYWWTRDANGAPLPASEDPNDLTFLQDPLSPLAAHIRHTENFRLQPLFPSNFIPQDNDAESVLTLDDEDEEAFAPSTLPSVRARERLQRRSVNEITLSMLLNNVVVLEEAIKEIVALMQVRSSLGVDLVHYAACQ